MMVIRGDQLQWQINFLIKNLLEVVLIMRSNKIFNQLKNYANQLSENFKKRTVYSGLRDNIWGVDLADMQLISKFNKGFRFLLCVIDIFSKYAWVIPLKDKKGVSIVNVFQKILKDSNRKT